MTQEIRSAYDIAAATYRKRYDGIPPRREDVDLAFEQVPTKNPTVVEIGCAYGREARYIITKTDRYIGVDISQKYIKMAREEIPTATFVCADVMDYGFVPGVDIVLAFASLLHNPKEDIAAVLERIAKALNSGGVVFLSLKKRNDYETAVETDDLVSRRFYYYTRQTILEILPPELTECYYNEQSRAEEWFTMILRKT